MPLVNSRLLLIAVAVAAVFLAPVHMEEVVECQDLGWKKGTVKPIDDCDIFKDEVTIDLTKIVSKPQCVKELEIRFEGVRQFIKSLTHSTGNETVPNRLTEWCSNVTVRVLLGMQNWKIYRPNFRLDPVACISRENLDFEEIQNTKKISINLGKKADKGASCLDLTATKVTDGNETKLTVERPRTDQIGVVAVVEVNRCKDETLTVSLAFKSGESLEKELKVPKNPDEKRCQVKDKKESNISTSTIAVVGMAGLVLVMGGVIGILVWKLKYKKKEAVVERGVVERNSIYGVYHRYGGGW